MNTYRSEVGDINCSSKTCYSDDLFTPSLEKKAPQANESLTQNNPRTQCADESQTQDRMISQRSNEPRNQICTSLQRADVNRTQDPMYTPSTNSWERFLWLAKRRIDFHKSGVQFLDWKQVDKLQQELNMYPTLMNTDLAHELKALSHTMMQLEIQNDIKMMKDLKRQKLVPSKAPFHCNKVTVASLEDFNVGLLTNANFLISPDSGISNTLGCGAKANLCQDDSEDEEIHYYSSRKELVGRCPQDDSKNKTYSYCLAQDDSRNEILCGNKLIGNKIRYHNAPKIQLINKNASKIENTDHRTSVSGIGLDICDDKLLGFVSKDTLDNQQCSEPEAVLEKKKKLCRVNKKNLGSKNIFCEDNLIYLPEDNLEKRTDSLKQKLLSGINVRNRKYLCEDNVEKRNSHHECHSRKKLDRFSDRRRHQSTMIRKDKSKNFSSIINAPVVVANKRPHKNTTKQINLCNDASMDLFCEDNETPPVRSDTQQMVCNIDFIGNSQELITTDAQEMVYDAYVKSKNHDYYKIKKLNIVGNKNDAQKIVHDANIAGNQSPEFCKNKNEKMVRHADSVESHYCPKSDTQKMVCHADGNKSHDFLASKTEKKECVGDNIFRFESNENQNMIYDIDVDSNKSYNYLTSNDDYLQLINYNKNLKHALDGETYSKADAYKSAIQKDKINSSNNTDCNSLLNECHKPHEAIAKQNTETYPDHDFIQKVSIITTKLATILDTLEFKEHFCEIIDQIRSLTEGIKEELSKNTENLEAKLKEKNTEAPEYVNGFFYMGPKGAISEIHNVSKIDVNNDELGLSYYEFDCDILRGYTETELHNVPNWNDLI